MDISHSLFFYNNQGLLEKLVYIANLSLYFFSMAGIMSIIFGICYISTSTNIASYCIISGCASIVLVFIIKRLLLCLHDRYYNVPLIST